MWCFQSARWLLFIYFTVFADNVNSETANTTEEIWDFEFGGASWEFEEPFNDCGLIKEQGGKYGGDDEDDENSRSPRQTPSQEETPTDEEIDEFIRSHEEDFSIIESKIHTFLKTLRINHHFRCRLKKRASIRSVMRARNKTLQTLSDVMAFRITMDKVSEVLRLRKLLWNHSKSMDTFFNITDEECYGICSDINMKYRSDGYRRVHINFHMNNKVGEIQLTTPYMTFWADYSHNLFYKGPESIKSDLHCKTYLRSLADYYYDLDYKRNLSPQCPSKLSKIDFKAILRDERLYKLLGEPQNGCLWWNDLHIDSSTTDECSCLEKPKAQALIGQSIENAVLPWKVATITLTGMILSVFLFVIVLFIRHKCKSQIIASAGPRMVRFENEYTGSSNPSVDPQLFTLELDSPSRSAQNIPAST